MGDINSYRGILQHLLNIRCVFPVSDQILEENENVFRASTVSSMYDNNQDLHLFLARCMKEKSDHPTLSRDFIEDVVARIRHFPNLQQDDQTAVLEILKYLSQHFFGSSPIIELNSMNDGLPASYQQIIPGTNSHPSIATAYKLIYAENKAIIIHNFAKHSLLSVSRFHSNTTLASGMLANTTGVGCKDLRLRFIIYQLLQAVSYIHSRGLCLESLDPCDIMLDDEMWVYLPIGLSNRLLKLASLKVQKKVNDVKTPSKQLQLIPFQPAHNKHSIDNIIPRPIDYYEPLTIQWIVGKITNFEYLMAVNYAAGRTMIDPLYHPILPWVTDFTTNCLDVLETPSYRDLSRTKFRLSKGDTQLETTFRHSDPPHHIPESLSELTYYIYLARRTPMQVLRRVVRDVFVPEHYPQSMHRIYEWTPDECIPEFYMDATVFRSIHRNFGLTDLDVPTFATSPEEFIRYHRQVLESDYVSRHLHLWIDLTFGYCLEGEAAIQHMNVPLHHTLSNSERQGLDSPRVNKNPGFVMLFDQPHPSRQLYNPALQNHIYHPTSPLIDDSSQHMPGEKGLSTTASNISISASHLIYSEAGNEKYQIKPIYLGNRHDYEGLEEWMDLELENAHLTKLFRTLQRESTLIGSSGKDLGSGKDSTTVSLNPSNLSGSNDMNYPMTNNHHLPPTKRGSRKSIVRPNTETSWNKFRYLEDVNLHTADKRGHRSVTNFFVQTDHYKFTDNTTAFIDGCYTLPEMSLTVEGETLSQKEKPDIRNWDEEFGCSVDLLEHVIQSQEKSSHEKLSQIVENHEKSNTKPKTEEEKDSNHLLRKDAELIEKYQAEDMFAVGCMIAELYNGRSLLSRNDTIAIASGQVSFTEYMEKVYKRTTGMPLVLQRLITLLIHRHPACRPHAQEILETCLIQNSENSALPPEDYLLGDEGVFQQLSQYLSLTLDHHLTHALQSKEQQQRFARMNILTDYCHSLFPDYFAMIYRIISSIKLASHGLLRLQALLNHVEDLLLLPIDGINLGLIHFFEVINDSEYFTDDMMESQRPANTTRTTTTSTNSMISRDSPAGEEGGGEEEEIVDARRVLMNYWRIIDVLGQRLGVENTEKLLVPHVVKFLTNFTAIDLLKELLLSPLWNILSLRAGVKCFLRSFLPILLTYLSAGTIHHVLIRKSYEYQHGMIGLGENVPLWTTTNTKISEKEEWLRKSSIMSIHRVQRAAVKAIANLSEIDALGSGLCARYVIPSLLSLVGVPQLASSGFEPRKAMEADMRDSSSFPTSGGENKDTNASNGGGNNNNSSNAAALAAAASITSEISDKFLEELLHQSVITRRTLLGDTDRPYLGDINRVPYEHQLDGEEAVNKSRSNSGNYHHSHSQLPEKLAQLWLNDKGLLESFILKYATFNAEHMYVVKVIVEMGTKLGDVVISELILSNIVNITLPELESQLSAVPKPGIAAALMEIILLLNGLLPILSPETIHHDLLQPSRLSGSCIPRLLSIWPLVPAFSFLDDLGEDLIGEFNIMYAIENVRMHTVLLELCRLIVSMSMIVGPDLTSEYVLPHLDNFFKNFVSSYGIFPVESRTMLKAFELGAEIYLPLVQIVSAEAFYTAVPNLNPRLELWLRGIGSNIPPKSPPLPGNIWPEATTEVSSRPEKKKPWIVQFFRGLSSSSSSNNASNSSNGNTATTTATPATVINYTNTSMPATPNQVPAFVNPPHTGGGNRSSITTGLLNSLHKSKSSTSTHSQSTQLTEEDQSEPSTTQPDQFPLSNLMDSIHQHTPQLAKKLINTNTSNNHNNFSPNPVGTELVELDSDQHKDGLKRSTTLPVPVNHQQQQLSQRDGRSLSPTPRGQQSGKSSSVPPSITSVLKYDENEPSSMKQATPFRRRRVHSSGSQSDEPKDFVQDEGSIVPGSDTSADSDDEEEEDSSPLNQVPLPSADMNVVVMEEVDADTINESTDIHEEENSSSSPDPALAHPLVTIETNKDISPVPLQHSDSINSPMGHNHTGIDANDSVIDISTEQIKIMDPSTIPSHNLTASLTTPRILFANNTGIGEDSSINPQALTSSKRDSMKIERKSLDDNTNPFRRYQRLLNQRAALKNQKYSHSFRESPARFRILHRRSSLTSSSSTNKSSQHAHQTSSLSSNSNYLIIHAPPAENETSEEVEFRESRFSELTWLLAGYGRWNVDKEMKDRITKEYQRGVKGGAGSSHVKVPFTSYYNSTTEWNPAAQISMTAPKIAVDVTGDLNTLINFQLQANTQWKLEDAPGLIRCMVTNANESLLMTCSRTGVRLFSLSTHPILHVSSYTNHSNPPFTAAFLRDGQHAMTCDGSIHLWDIESRQPLGIIIPLDKQIGYSSASVIPSRYGIHPSIDSIGDEQILATISDTVSYFDIRCNYSKPMNRVAEWILPQIPPLQGNFISTIAEPLQLTCAYSHENYVFAGSMTGGIYIVERRMGKVLNSWQAHEGPILKLQALSEKHVLAVSDRSAAVWEYLPEVSTATYPMSSLYPGTFSTHAYNKSIHNTPIAYHEFRDLHTSSSSSISGSTGLGNVSLSAYHMGYGGIGEVRKVLNIKNPSDSSYLANNIIVSSFENIANQYYPNPLGHSQSGGGGSSNTTGAGGGLGGSGGPFTISTAMHKYSGVYENNANTKGNDGLGGMGGAGLLGSSYGSLAPSKAQKILYCLSGHRMHSAFLPAFTDLSSTSSSNPSGYGRRMQGKEVVTDWEDLKLSTNYFLDRRGSKLTRSKMQITSSVLLPLRRLLLIGSEDGFVRVIS